MPCCRPVFLFALACALLASHCSPRVDDAKPVATPSVRLDKTEAAPGAPVDITYQFSVAADAPPLPDGYVVFVHFMDDTGERMWTDDHVPPTPTSSWKPGETIEYQRTIFVPKFPYTGRTDIQLGLYLPSSGERLPLSGEDRGMRAYRVGQFNLAQQADGVFVVFKDGWHNAEVTEDGSQQWQWSRREATLSFRNLQRDAELLLQLDQPVEGLPQPQQVEVRLGGSAVDSFALAPGRTELRRIDLPASLVGDAETVEMTIAVDRTFVPSDVPALRSADARELGVRVFHAYVEPK